MLRKYRHLRNGYIDSRQRARHWLLMLSGLCGCRNRGRADKQESSSIIMMARMNTAVGSALGQREGFMILLCCLGAGGKIYLGMRPHASRGGLQCRHKKPDILKLHANLQVPPHRRFRRPHVPAHKCLASLKLAEIWVSASYFQGA